MPIKAKWALSIFIVAFLIAFAMIDSKANNAGIDRNWRWGKNDPIRLLLMRPDGSFRKFTKLSAIGFYVVLLAVIWAIVPSTSEP